MADEIRNDSFETDLYRAISLLSFWEEGKVSVNQAGVLFQMDNISAVEEFKAIGMASLDIREEQERPVEFMTLGIILAKNVPQDKIPQITAKLYDVNLGLKEGMFYVDSENNLSYETNFPILRGDITSSLQLFISVYNDTSNYIDGVYPYLLRLIAKPEDSSFDEYIAALLSEE